MKKLIVLALSNILLFQTMVAQSHYTVAATAKIKQLSPYFSFTAKGSPQGTLTSQQPAGQFLVKEKKEEGFAIKMLVTLKPFTGEQMLAEIPGLVSIKLRQANPLARDKQNYPAALMQDGSLPVLEAGVMLTSPLVNVFKRQLDIGYPLAALAKPWGEHEVVVNFTGVRWTIYVDGALMDNEFAIGYPRFDAEASWQINPAFVSQASIFLPAFTAERDSLKNDNNTPGMQYWTPRGHNSWVGDVATIFYNGRYHVFYLFDRRHHGSKMGVGGHYFEHFSTTDFINWTEHEAATPIDEQWETIGTGTPFIYNNKLNISYGLHTSRIYPDSLTTYPRIMDYYNRHQQTGYFLAGSGQGFPSGSTYSTSADNISNFKKSGVLFHYCENPSIFTSPDGKLKMFANYKSKGTWESASLDSGWHCTDPNFPLGGDCTFYFTWGKYEYVVGGFESLWKRPVGNNNAPWEDEVANGMDFYDGINVPSISAIGNGRYLEAGWIPITGWGGPFIIHELLQQPGGRLRSKWMPEMVPAALDTVVLAKRIDSSGIFTVKNQSFLLSFDVYPGTKNNGQLAVSFLSAGDSLYVNAGALQINLAAKTAQYNTAVNGAFALPENSLRQGGTPQTVGNYAIENLTGINKPFSVRIAVKNNPKLGGTILDTEIAGQNTLISYRNGLNVKNISFTLAGSTIGNVKMMKIED